MSNRPTPIVTMDFETRSYADLKKVGAWAYAEHPTTDILCLCWSDGMWWSPHMDAAGTPLVALFWHVRSGGLIAAFNAEFEYAIWNMHMVPVYGAPPLKPEQMRCTQAIASYYHMPGSLDGVLKALRIPHEKNKVGRAAMMRLTKPQAKTRKRAAGFLDPVGNGLADCITYCHSDVYAEEQVRNLLGPLPDEARLDYQIDLEINERGVAIDRRSVAAVQKKAEIINSRLGTRFREITNLNPTQNVAFAKWLNEAGFEVDGADKEIVEGLLEREDLPPHVREACALRRRLAKSSVSKLRVMLDGCNTDGRIRGLHKWHGASTGRKAGRLLQTQNMPRPSIPWNEDNPNEMNELIDFLVTASVDEIMARYDEPMNAISTALRGFIVPGGGRRFVGFDLGQIEARVLAHLAGETWKLQAFREIDAGSGSDIYCVAASRVFGYEVTSKKTHPTERQTGKTAELACGYQGSVGAWRKFDKTKPDDEVKKVVYQWRDANPAIVSFWAKLEQAAIAAVNGGDQQVGSITYRMNSDWLECILPSGRSIWYFEPKLEYKETDYGQKLALTHMTNEAGQWVRRATYGGRLAENVTQAVAADILLGAMRALKNWRYIVLTVHDEIVCEVDHLAADYVFGQAQHAMTTNPSWSINMLTAAGTRETLPLAADGAILERFQK